MYILRKLGLLPVVALMIGVVGVASASAAQFTASATGSITGKALANQTFVFNGGSVQCNTAETTGTISSTTSTEQHVTVHYKGCSGFGYPEVNISPATYLFTADGDLHIKETITIQVNVPFFPDCHVTIQSQTVRPVDYANNGSNLKVTPTITGIVYQTSSLPFNPCGSSGSNGTFSGANEFSRVGGGSFSWDA